ncbi:MAG: sigma-54 interaction domain-containing protein, partial [Acidobacteriota bacterium]
RQDVGGVPAGGASLRQGEPCRPTEILQSVEQILDREVPAPAGPGATNSTGKIFGTTEIIGASPAMEAVFNLTHRLAGSRAPVLITGETGTGKELIARALHDASPWSDQPFVAVDCGALGESMAEAELFGHVKGAFSGAHQSRIGLLRTAHGGTLFLDELGNLGPSLQLKLLRVLESGEVRPVGSDRIHIVNIRLVAATNAHLAAEVTAGRFRRDLYHRLSGGLIHLPPLRERMEDLPLLVEQFLKEMTPEAAVSQSSDDPPRLSPAAWNLLHRHSWPGNVRELRLALEVALSMAGGPVVEACHLPATLSQDSLKSRPTSRLHRSVSPPALDCLKMPDTLEGKMVLKVLAETAWDKTRAARRIGWSRQKLYRAMKKYAIPTRLSAAKVEELQNHLQKDPEHSLNGLPP